MHTLYTLIMPSRGSKHRIFRGLTDEEWEAFDHTTKARGTNKSAVLREYVRFYLRRGTAPKRPTEEQE